LVELLTGDEGVAPEQPVSATLPADEEQALVASLRHPADSRDRPVVVSVLGPAHTVELLDELVVGLIARYEIEGPQRLVLEARALRRLASSLGSELSGRGERAGLARVCARQSALLASMSVNLGQFAAAEGYALEANLLATAAGDHELCAWIKGTESFAAYYEGRYRDAENLALSGLRIARDDGQRIRLLSNGVARAAGKLGDKRAVDLAIDEAFELVAVNEVPRGMSPCIDFAPYSWARAAANAATAYLSVGDYARALELTGQVSSEVDSSNSDWSRALVQLDQANALALGQSADLEHAATLGTMALAGSAAKPIASISSRAEELAASLRRRGPHRAGDEFALSVREWQRRARMLTA
jgi:tetratricopeptide (TPR) repeat protein